MSASPRFEVAFRPGHGYCVVNASRHHMHLLKHVSPEPNPTYLGVVQAVVDLLNAATSGDGDRLIAQAKLFSSQNGWDLGDAPAARVIRKRAKTQIRRHVTIAIPPQ